MPKYEKSAGTKVTKLTYDIINELIEEGHHRTQGELIREAIRRYIKELRDSEPKPVLSKRIEDIEERVTRIEKFIFNDLEDQEVETLSDLLMQRLSGIEDLLQGIDSKNYPQKKQQ